MPHSGTSFRNTSASCILQWAREELQRSPQDNVPQSQGCIAAVLALLSWIGSGPQYSRSGLTIFFVQWYNIEWMFFLNSLLMIPRMKLASFTAAVCWVDTSSSCVSPFQDLSPNLSQTVQNPSAYMGNVDVLPLCASLYTYSILNCICHFATYSPSLPRYFWIFSQSSLDFTT